MKKKKRKKRKKKEKKKKKKKKKKIPHSDKCSLPFGRLVFILFTPAQSQLCMTFTQRSGVYLE
jgi:hypothetical protein